jgi:hypothetical protein
MPIKLDNIELQPGENEVSDNDFKELEKHPDFIFWLRQGAFVLTTKTTTTIGVETVTEVPPAAVTLSDDEIIAEARRRGLLAEEAPEIAAAIQPELTAILNSEPAREGDSSNLEIELGDPSKKATIRKK